VQVRKIVKTACGSFCRFSRARFMSAVNNASSISSMALVTATRQRNPLEFFAPPACPVHMLNNRQLWDIGGIGRLIPPAHAFCFAYPCASRNIFHECNGKKHVTD
jgi:hypothetical protein